MRYSIKWKCLCCNKIHNWDWDHETVAGLKQECETKFICDNCERETIILYDSATQKIISINTKQFIGSIEARNIEAINNVNEEFSEKTAYICVKCNKIYFDIYDAKKCFYSHDVDKCSFCGKEDKMEEAKLIKASESVTIIDEKTYGTFCINLCSKCLNDLYRNRIKN